MKSERVSKYIITNGEYYVANSNGTSFKKNKTDAFMWSLKDSAENVLANNMQEKKGYKVKETYVYQSDIDPDILMDISTITNFLDIVIDSFETETQLRELLSKTDRCISDILHFIELNDVNSVRGFKVYKQLQAYSRQCRAIKNRLKIVESINKLEIDPQILKTLLGQYKEKFYTPRELDFDDDIWK